MADDREHRQRIRDAFTRQARTMEDPRLNQALTSGLSWLLSIADPRPDDARSAPSASDGPSVEEKGIGHGLDADFLAWAVEQWAPDHEQRLDPMLSPIRIPDLRGLPRTLLVTAEHDALRDEGEAYAKRMTEAGVPVTYRCEPGLVHGFIQGMDLTSPEAAAAHERVFVDIRALVEKTP